MIGSSVVEVDKAKNIINTVCNIINMVYHIINMVFFRKILLYKTNQKSPQKC
jgi:hypothetical protein